MLVYTPTHTHIHTHTHVLMNMCLKRHERSTCIHTHKHTHTHTHMIRELNEIDKLRKNMMQLESYFVHLCTQKHTHRSVDPEIPLQLFTESSKKELYMRLMHKHLQCVKDMKSAFYRNVLQQE
eukprot:GHVR01096249.1.p1 GENE.GHVR01096249.1~~GHVR01096249.1.p1  ORF type:complete len:123 (-),score=64.63 GHVR01096249.1:181-549(-)